jgi:hypothetical protein
MRVRRRVDEDAIVIGSKEWRSLSHSRRRAIQDKRNGVISVKVQPDTEGFVEIDDVEEAPKTKVAEVRPKHEIVIRHLTPEEADEQLIRGSKAWREWEGRYSEQPNVDDQQKGDVYTFHPGVIVTKEREFEGHKIQRRNPHGFWFVLGLENELGSHLTLADAQDALLKYLEDNHE